MSTHILLDPTKSHYRKLLEACDFCDAKPGEPCHVTVGRKGEYICPEKSCEQLYEKANDALNCIMHKRT